VCACDRYTEVANNVQMQETILTIQFVLLDSSPLKFAILAHCQEWQNKFTGLLYDIATSRLTDLDGYLDSMKIKCVVTRCSLSVNCLYRKHIVICRKHIHTHVHNHVLFTGSCCEFHRRHYKICCHLVGYILVDTCSHMSPIVS